MENIFTNIENVCAMIFAKTYFETVVGYLSFLTQIDLKAARNIGIAKIVDDTFLNHNLLDHRFVIPIYF